jgi:hypothetical protein
VIEQAFLYRVFVEPDDGAQPPGDGGPGGAAGFQVADEAFDVGTADPGTGAGGAGRLATAPIVAGRRARVVKPCRALPAGELVCNQQRIMHGRHATATVPGTRAAAG